MLADENNTFSYERFTLQQNKNNKFFCLNAKTFLHHRSRTMKSTNKSKTHINQQIFVYTHNMLRIQAEQIRNYVVTSGTKLRNIP